MAFRKKVSREAEIPTSSMSDIAFLLLVFFLVTTHFQRDTGIVTKLPPSGETQEAQENIVLSIVVPEDTLVAGDSVKVGGVKVPFSDLQSAVYDSVSTAIESRKMKAPLIFVEKGVTYERMLEVYEEVMKAADKLDLEHPELPEADWFNKQTVAALISVQLRPITGW
ncbi:biopolymer transporter ExbD [candidate division WOR-3 bacterium]|nr:biopolymer transporter ExbD [candidate division WOR-3 bacterium]